MDFDHNDEKLEIWAREMGISTDELVELKYSEGEDVSPDGLVYAYFLQFEPDNPWQIMVKIKGLHGDTVRLHPGLFETPDPEPE